ncbi:hypothetical protein V1511DRAFT_489049 [Dipodascopsis uninucleata]
MATLEVSDYQKDGAIDIEEPSSTIVDSNSTNNGDLRHRRLRWATQRRPNNGRQHRYSQRLKRLSILPKHRHSSSGALERVASGTDRFATSTNEPTGEGDANSQPHRRVYVNLPLPVSDLDENGSPLTQYPRNKTRSAKYTPLTFIPKNLYLQFNNIANIYFLFIVILSAFSIFGVQDAGLSAVPVIVIVTLTAIKDAIEDYRRTVLDLELNNSPTQILANWVNNNVSEDNVSLWRRIKKASTRVSIRFVRFLKRNVGTKSQRRKVRAKQRAHRRAEQSMEDDDDELSDIELEHTATFSAIQADMGKNQPQSFPLQELQRLSHELPKGANPFDDGEQQPVPDYRKPSIDYTHGTILDHIRPVPGTAKFKKDFWKNVRVGDFVRIKNDDQIPADIVILSTSDSDGACYVETKNLDGETNLKVKQALRCGQGIRHSRDCERAAFIIESEAPHPNLYSYSGVIRWSQRDPERPEVPPQEMAEPISINNLLLRGCSLRNTEWVIGVVMFTGHETKIMLNAGETPTKRSRIARELNINVLYNFVLLFIICMIVGVIEGLRWRKSGNTIQWFEFGSIGGTPALDGLVTFFTAVIMFQSLVPIALFITLEIIKTIQALFIWSDVNMYYEPIDQPCIPKSWNISDDLGQIEYIFSDKTGTLTQNIMELKKVTVNGVSYGEAYTEAMAGIQKRQGLNVEEESAKANEHIAETKAQMIEDLKSIHDNPYMNTDKITFIASDYVADMMGESGDEQADATNNFMLALALCHSVLPEHVSNEPPEIQFKAQSPDEAALVATARDMGFTLVDRTQRGVVLNIQGQVQEYQVLTTLEFNSTRKRMTAIVRMPDDGRIMLFCKGADSIIYSRLKANEQHELKEATAEHLEQFANEGLRTLCIAQRELSEEEYNLWSKQYDDAAAALVDREDKVEIAADRIERELVLLGGTAIEDRLQDGVPDAISLMGQAGIKLWVLTGDKVETAINIGFSCNILDTSMELIVIQLPQDSTLADAESKLMEYMDKYFHLKGTVEELAQAKKDHRPPPPTHAVIIDGESLKLMLDETLRTRFLLMCKQCRSVLCCRVSPAQKAAVVKMVKNGLDVMTLAIGDGANDVAMILAADVGVGIAGEEGRQAVMSSDYAIGQFCYLTRLILVHGRWSYRRLGETIANFFYKNLIFTLSLFWYQIFNDFDCSYLFDYTYILLYSLAFTSLPIIFLGVFDQDVSDKISLAVPELYQRGMLRLEWTQKKFWIYMFDGAYQSVVCFFFTYALFASGGFATSSGNQLNTRLIMGVFVATSAVAIANSYVLLNQYRWDYLSLIISVVSSLLIFFWTGIYTTTEYSAEFHGAAPEAYGSLIFWLTVLLTIITAMLPQFLKKSVQKLYMPSDIDIIREQVVTGAFDYLQDIPDETFLHASTTMQPKEKSQQRNTGSNGSDSVTATSEGIFNNNGKRNSF